MAQRKRVYRINKEKDKEQLLRTKTYSREPVSHTLDSLTIQKARINSGALKREEVPRLQHTIGNQATSKLLDNSSVLGSFESVVHQQGSRSRSTSEGTLPRPMDSSSPEVTRYTDPKVAQRLNQILRGGKVPEHGTAECKLYGNLISKMNLEQGPELVYRGLKLENDTLRLDENGFMSTSKGNPYPGDNLLILDVSQVRRVDIEKLSHFGLQWDDWLPERNEQEVLVQPMTHLNIEREGLDNIRNDAREIAYKWMKNKEYARGKLRFIQAKVVDRSSFEQLG